MMGSRPRPNPPPEVDVLVSSGSPTSRCRIESPEFFVSSLDQRRRVGAVSSVDAGLEEAPGFAPVSRIPFDHSRKELDPSKGDRVARTRRP